MEDPGIGLRGEAASPRLLQWRGGSVSVARGWPRGHGALANLWCPVFLIAIYDVTFLKMVFAFAVNWLFSSYHSSI